MCTFNMTLLEDQNRQAFVALFQRQYRMMTGQTRRRLQQYPTYPSSTPKPQPVATGPEPGASMPPGFGEQGLPEFGVPLAGIPEEHAKMLGKLQEMGINPEDWDPAKGPPEDVLAKFPGDEQAILKEMLKTYGGPDALTDLPLAGIPEEHAKMLGKLQEMGINPEDWDPAKGPPEDVLAKFPGDEQAILKEMLKTYGSPGNAADPLFGSSGFPFDFPEGGTMPFGDFYDSTMPVPGKEEYSGPKPMPFEDYLEAVKKTVKRFPKACCAESEAACTQDDDCKWESYGMEGHGMCRALDPRLADLPSVWPEYMPNTPEPNRCEHSEVRTPPDPAALGGIDGFTD